MPGSVDRPPDFVHDWRALKARVHSLEQNRSRGIDGGALGISTTFPVPNATSTIVDFSASWATDGIVDADVLADGTRLTVLRSGLWVITANVVFASNATGYRSVEVRRNGDADPLVIGDTRAAVNGAPTRCSGAQILALNADDYLETYVTQTSGGPLDLDGLDGVAGPGEPMVLTVCRVGGQALS